MTSVNVTAVDIKYRSFKMTVDKVYGEICHDLWLE